VAGTPGLVAQPEAAERPLANAKAPGAGHPSAALEVPSLALAGIERRRQRLEGRLHGEPRRPESALRPRLAAGDEDRGVGDVLRWPVVDEPPALERFLAGEREAADPQV